MACLLDARCAGEEWSFCASLRHIGREVRTLGMQAGLIDRKLTFPDVFTDVRNFFHFVAMLLGVRCKRQGREPWLAAA